MGHGSDLLLHAILDRLVDNYQPVLDQYDAQIDRLEESLFNVAPKDYLATVMQAKRARGLSHLYLYHLPSDVEFTAGDSWRARQSTLSDA